jgi:hypothetical protein
VVNPQRNSIEIQMQRRAHSPATMQTAAQTVARVRVAAQRTTTIFVLFFI